jgi:hypothetical protein
MIVYFIVNEATEMGYVGKTVGTLDDRWRGHIAAAESGSDLPFHEAIREWGTEVWLCVILQHCYTEQELNTAEGNWIRYLCTSEQNVGYNIKRMRTAWSSAEDWIMRSQSVFSKYGKLARDNPNSARPRDQMTPERIEFFKQCGRRGAKRKEDMSEEEREKFREWGRKGAERAKLRKSKKL